jgi:hypothetical protein
MPTPLAYLALLSWPLVAIVLFITQKSFERAIIWSVVASFLLLPQRPAFNFPGVPPLTKETIPSLTLLIIVLLVARRPVRLFPENRLAQLLLAAVVIAPFFTAGFNQDPLQIGIKFLPGLTYYDALSSIGDALLMMVPFLIGRACLASPEAHREILRVLLISGLAYSVLILVEIRLSPQLNIWIYGFFPHSFMQHVRGGGFRPLVFLPHALWVAFFVMTATVAAAVLWRASRTSSVPSGRNGTPERSAYLAATGYLGVVLILCKSMASIAYGFFLVSTVAFARPRTQLWIAAALVMLAISYPATRGAGLFPTETILEVSGAIDENREASLQTRFRNEDALLDKASQRPVFGWGSWGRNRLYDPETGKDAGVTDGYWIITVSSFGWAGFLAKFGLLGLPVLAALRRHRRTGEEPDPVVSGICLIAAINMVELLPNSTLPPWTWLIAGALLGYAEKKETQPGPAARKGVGAFRRQRTIL